jgi:hypothetical protein
VEGTDKLFHTVSFYRKQKTPMQLKNVVRQPEPIAFNIEEKDVRKVYLLSVESLK